MSALLASSAVANGVDTTRTGSQNVIKGQLSIVNNSDKIMYIVPGKGDIYKSATSTVRVNGQSITEQGVKINPNGDKATIDYSFVVKDRNVVPESVTCSENTQTLDYSDSYISNSLKPTYQKYNLLTSKDVRDFFKHDYSVLKVDGSVAGYYGNSNTCQQKGTDYVNNIKGQDGPLSSYDYINLGLQYVDYDGSGDYKDITSINNLQIKPSSNKSVGVDIVQDEFNIKSTHTYNGAYLGTSDLWAIREFNNNMVKYPNNLNLMVNTKCYPFSSLCLKEKEQIKSGTFVISKK